MRSVRHGRWILASLCATSCAGRETVGAPDGVDDGCLDADHDGFGEGGDCAGPDCDDAIAQVHEAEDCDARCADDPFATNCPCETDLPCYGGPEGTLRVGTCAEGTRTCAGGLWVQCLGDTRPHREEGCDGFDDDCDGLVDETSCLECGGTCTRECYGDCEEGGGDRVSAKGIARTESGALVLDAGATEGEIVVRMDQCIREWGESPSWSLLDWAMDVPAGTSLSIAVRIGRDEADLVAAPWQVVAAVPPDIPAIPLDDLEGFSRLLDVRVRLASAVEARPRVDWIAVEAFCWHGD